MSSVYRYMSLEKFLNMTLENSITLVQPDLWDDPFENLVLKAMRTVNGREEVKRIYKDIYNDGTKDYWALESIDTDVYGQSWTMCKESDALWRIYSSNNVSIRVEVDRDNLLKLGNDSIVLKSDSVEYIPNITLDSEVKKIFLDGYTRWEKAFLTKRLPFEHEEEFRLLALKKRSDGEKTMSLSYGHIDKFVKSVALHPLAPKWVDTTVRKYCFEKKLLYVGKSKLYDKEY